MYVNKSLKNMEMENNQIMLMEKLGVLEILKEAFKIPYKCPKFIILTFFTSLPLFITMVLHENLLQKTMIETKTFLQPPPTDPYFYELSYTSLWEPMETTIRLLQAISPRLLQLGLLYLIPLHLLDLINTVTTVDLVSAINAAERPMSLKEMLYIPIKKTRFKGPLITSIYVLWLNFIFMFGLIWAVGNFIISPFGSFFVVLYGLCSILLLVKWMDLSAIWNMSIVFSILEERHGLQALGASAYFSRGNRKRGLYLMLIFFVWRIGLRFSCLYMGGHEKWEGLVATSILSCIGNVMKWVVCLVYYYDCKKRVLEKKVDVEDGGKVDVANMVST